jgi:hypothetical protein
MADYSNIKSLDVVMTPSMKKLFYLSIFFLLESGNLIEERGVHDIKKQVMDDILEKAIYPKLDYINHPLAKKFMDQNVETKPDVTPDMVNRIIKDVVELELYPSIPAEDFEKEFDDFCANMSKERVYGDYIRREEDEAEELRKK